MNAEDPSYIVPATGFEKPCRLIEFVPWNAKDDSWPWGEHVKASSPTLTRDTIWDLSVLINRAIARLNYEADKAGTPSKGEFAIMIKLVDGEGLRFYSRARLVPID